MCWDVGVAPGSHLAFVYSEDLPATIHFWARESGLVFNSAQWIVFGFAGNLHMLADARMRIILVCVWNMLAFISLWKGLVQEGLFIFEAGLVEHLVS